MFLQRFKKKSIRKSINKILNSRNVSVNNNKIESVGIILNLDEFNNHDALRQFLNSLGIMENKIKVITFLTDEKLAPNTWDAYCPELITFRIFYN